MILSLWYQRHSVLLMWTRVPVTYNTNLTQDISSRLIADNQLLVLAPVHVDVLLTPINCSHWSSSSFIRIIATFDCHPRIINHNNNWIQERSANLHVNLWSQGSTWWFPHTGFFQLIIMSYVSVNNTGFLGFSMIKGTFMVLNYASAILK